MMPEYQRYYADTPWNHKRPPYENDSLRAMWQVPCKVFELIRIIYGNAGGSIRLRQQWSL